VIDEIEEPKKGGTYFKISLILVMLAMLIVVILEDINDRDIA